jgi:hypothetical protein
MMGLDPDEVRSKLEGIDDEVARLRAEQDERLAPWTAIEPSGASGPMERPRGSPLAAGQD